MFRLQGLGLRDLALLASLASLASRFAGGLKSRL